MQLSLAIKCGAAAKIENHKSGVGPQLQGLLRRSRAAYSHGCGTRACKIGAVKPAYRRMRARGPYVGLWEVSGDAPLGRRALGNRFVPPRGGYRLRCARLQSPGTEEARQRRRGFEALRRDRFSARARLRRPRRGRRARARNSSGSSVGSRGRVRRRDQRSTLSTGGVVEGGSLRRRATLPESGRRRSASGRRRWLIRTGSCGAPGRRWRTPCRSGSRRCA
jgi:hypothetical protein